MLATFCAARGAAAAAIFAVAGCAGAFFETSLDVPYVATPQPVVDEMLRLARVTGDDYLIDLGSGDGRIVITAARRYGTRGLGVDLDPRRIEESIANAREARVTDKVEFRQQNIFETDLRQASVVTMFLLPTLNVQLRPKLFAELKPGTRVVSHKWEMGDWQPDRVVTVSDEGASIYLWTIPPNVSGRWTARAGANGQTEEVEITINQRHQFISASLLTHDARLTAETARIRGDEIELVFSNPYAAVDDRWAFSGRIKGDKIAGVVVRQTQRASGEAPWRATRNP